MTEDQETTLRSSLDISDGAHALAGFGPGYMLGDEYELTEFLGRGGMGVVFKAKHKIIGKKYAVKILPPELINPDNWKRFEREARTLARLAHPGIVAVYNMGIDRERCPYLVMDLILGRPLSDFTALSSERKTNSYQKTLTIYLKVAEALAQAHRRGIIHRDVKPSNIMVEFDKSGNVDSVKLVDFGLALPVDARELNQNLTATGQVFGSPYYMSPEQCRGERAGTQSDMYSFGCSLFESLTGNPPFKGRNIIETFSMHQTEPVPSVNNFFDDARLAASLNTVLQRLMAKEPASRYGDFSIVAHELQRIIEGRAVGVHALHQQTKTLTVHEFEQSSKGTTKSPVIFAFFLFTILTLSLLIYFFNESNAAKLRASKPANPRPIELSKKNVSSHPETYEFKIERVDNNRLDIRYPEKSRVIFLDSKNKEIASELDSEETHAPLCQLPFTIDFTAESVSPSSFREFNQFPISGFKVTRLVSDESWQSFAELFDRKYPLKTLVLRYSTIRSKHSRALKHFTSLEVVSLYKCKVEPAVLTQLAAIDSLQNCTIRDPIPLSPTGDETTPNDVEWDQALNFLLSNLRKKERTETVRLENPRMSKKSMSQILTMKSIRAMAISGYKWSPEEFSRLADMPLNSLSISPYDFEQTLLPELMKSKSLKKIVLTGKATRKLAKTLIQNPTNAAGQRIDLVLQHGSD